MREHIITGQSNDPIKNLPAPMWMWWPYTIKDDVTINFFQPGPNQIGFVKYAHHQVNFGPGNGTIDFAITEKWEDPRTGMNLPVRWTLRMEQDDCVVDVEIAAHGRAYSYWPVASGARMYCYLLSTMIGTVTLPDGRVITLDEHLTVNSFCRTIPLQGRTSAAPSRFSTEPTARNPWVPCRVASRRRGRAPMRRERRIASACEACIGMTDGSGRGRSDSSIPGPYAGSMRTVGRRGRPPASSRTALAEVAVELFFDHGYAGTTIAMIAEKAGISKTSFFRYFSSKSEIVWSDFDIHTERLRARLAADRASGPAADRASGLAALPAAIVDTLRSDLDPAGVSLRRFELLDTSPDLRSKETVRWFAWADVVTEHLRLAAGHDRPTALQAAAGSAMQATMLAVLRDGVRDRSSPEQILTHLDSELGRLCSAFEPLLGD